MSILKKAKVCVITREEHKKLSHKIESKEKYKETKIKLVKVR